MRGTALQSPPMCVVRLGPLCVVLMTAGLGAQGSSPTCATRGIEQWQATRPSPLDSATVVVDGRVAVIRTVP